MYLLTSLMVSWDTIVAGLNISRYLSFATSIITALVDKLEVSICCSFRDDTYYTE